MRIASRKRALYSTVQGTSGTPTRRRHPQSTGDTYPIVTNRTCRVGLASAERRSLPRLHCCSPTRGGSISPRALFPRGGLCRWHFWGRFLTRGATPDDPHARCRAWEPQATGHEHLRQRCRCGHVSPAGRL